jgi:hypothetical protein
VQDGGSHSGVAEDTSLWILCHVDWFWFDYLTLKVKMFLQYIGNYQSAWCDIVEDFNLHIFWYFNFL